jgi:hypothetical protein
VRLLRGALPALPLTVWSFAAIAGSEPPVPASALHACAAISTPGERLACYDQLAGRASAPPTASAPAAAPQPSPGVAAPASPTPPPKGSFGLYHAEHPAAPPPAASLTAKVVGIGATASGHPTVALEGGQLWELDGPDPLLASGDSVTIQRASFGSFVMTTPTRRTHRVHRLR